MRSAPTKLKIKNHGAISTRKIKLIYHLKSQVKILLSKSLSNFTPPPAMSLRSYFKFKTVGNCRRNKKISKMIDYITPAYIPGPYIYMQGD